MLYARYIALTRLVSPRDFLNVFNWTVESDGTIYFAAMATKHAGAPEYSGIVRGDVKVLCVACVCMYAGSMRSMAVSVLM